MSADGAETRDRIMEATYEALVETGYADLTMNDIATFSNSSTSLLHYHFDTKEDLLVAFLEDLVANIEEDLAERAPSDPIDRIHHIVRWYILDPDEKEREAFHVALLELRVQAPRNDRYRRRIREADRVIRDGLTHAIEDGIEADLIEPGDPEATAALLLATVDGAETRLLMTGEDIYAETVHDAFSERLLASVLTPEGIKRWRTLTEEQ